MSGHGPFASASIAKPLSGPPSSVPIGSGTCRSTCTDRDALEKAFDEIVASESFVDILVNNAHELGRATGFNTPEGSLENTTPEQ